MFLVMRRIFASLPLASLLIGWIGQPGWLLVPPALTAGFVLWRDRAIRSRIGAAAWPSDGFARHALVDDMAKLLLVTLAGLPLFLLAQSLRALLP